MKRDAAMTSFTGRTPSAHSLVLWKGGVARGMTRGFHSRVRARYDACADTHTCPTRAQQPHCQPCPALPTSSFCVPNHFHATLTCSSAHLSRYLTTPLQEQTLPWPHAQIARGAHARSIGNAVHPKPSLHTTLFSTLISRLMPSTSHT